MPVLRLENVGLKYGDGPEILRDVSFSVRPGDFYFLTGPSGALIKVPASRCNSASAASRLPASSPKAR